MADKLVGTLLRRNTLLLWWRTSEIWKLNNIVLISSPNKQVSMLKAKATQTFNLMTKRGLKKNYRKTDPLVEEFRCLISPIGTFRQRIKSLMRPWKEQWTSVTKREIHGLKTYQHYYIWFPTWSGTWLQNEENPKKKIKCREQKKKKNQSKVQQIILVVMSNMTGGPNKMKVGHNYY